MNSKNGWNTLIFETFDASIFEPHQPPLSSLANYSAATFHHLCKLKHLWLSDVYAEKGIDSTELYQKCFRSLTSKSRHTNLI